MSRELRVVTQNQRLSLTSVWDECDSSLTRV